MDKRVIFMALTIMLLFGRASSASTISPAKIVSGFVSNAVSALMKWLWSLKSTTKTVTGRPLMKFEGGYNVETVFDGSKLGIEPHSIEVMPNGELLILDADNSNIYRISSSLSLYSRPKLVAGSFEGYTGHVDGKPRDARFNHPNGIAVDDRGNIYVADTTNHAIRKISDAGVTTIAGGKGSRGTEGGHVDGPGEDAKFSNDLDVVYIGSSCSLLVIDRGNQAIREIQLHFDDCAYQYGSSFPLGIAVLFAAGFFGYMLALLQHRVWTIVSSQNAQDPPNAYTKPLKSARPPLIPSEDEQEKPEEGIFGSTRKLYTDTVMGILGGVFPCFRKKQRQNRQQHQPKHSSSWPVQDSFEVPAEDQPPSIEARTPTPRKTYAFMSKDPEKLQLLRQGRAFYNGHTEFQHQNQHQSSTPYTFYEQSHENAKEVVFGAVQELDGHATVIIKPVNYGDSSYDHQSFRYRMNSTGYSNGY